MENSLTLTLARSQAKRPKVEVEIGRRVFPGDSSKYIFNAYNYFQQTACEIKIKLRRRG